MGAGCAGALDLFLFTGDLTTGVRLRLRVEALSVSGCSVARAAAGGRLSMSMATSTSSSQLTGFVEMVWKMDLSVCGCR